MADTVSINYNYMQVKHTTEGDVLGQTLSYDTYDEWLLEYHTQMKNAINNTKVLGMSILVVDEQLKTVYSENWIRDSHDVPTSAPAENAETNAETNAEPTE